MLDRRVEVVARLKSLEEAAAPLVTFLQNPNVVQELRADKQYNLQMLNEHYQILMRLFLSELYLFIESSSKQDMADVLELIHLLYHDNGRTQIIDLFNQDK
ncbi:eukaryotic translation initiation factor 3 subunit E [Tanacetum coccineum]